MNDGMLRQLGRRVAMMIGSGKITGTAMPAAFKNYSIRRHWR